MKRSGLLFAVTMVAVMSGCTAGSDDIRLLEVKDVGMSSLSRAGLTLVVENGSRSNVKVLSGRLTINMEGAEIAEIMLLEPVAVRRRSVEEVELNFGLRVINQFAMLSVMSNPDRITASGNVKLSAGLFPKKIEFRELTFSQITSIFGTPNRTIEQ